MAHTIYSLVEKLEEAAIELDDPQALELARTIREYSGTAKLQILVVGSTGSGRSSVVNAVLRQASLLPRSPLPKAPLGILVRYGPSSLAEIVAVDGTRSALPPAKLRSFLTSAASVDGPGTRPPRGGLQRVLAVEVQAPCELLKTCDLRIEPLEADRHPEGTRQQWRDLLAGSDVTLLVLNATALLSHQERQFVQNYLVDGYGLQRVAIIVNQMDLVPEEERNTILELVRTFLGPYESQPAVLEFSASEALEELDTEGQPEGTRQALTTPKPAAGSPKPAAGYPVPDGYGALNTLVGDLVERYGPLREAALHAALDAALAELMEGVARQQALLSIDQTEADELRETLASRRQWLQQRVERTQRKVDTFVGTLIKEEFLRAGEGFGEVFRRRLPDEIMQIEDMSTIKRHLPGYIETAWAEFLHRQMLVVRSRLIEETRSVDQLIKNDLEELLGSRAAGVRHLLADFALGSEALRTFIMPKRGKHRAAGAARMLSLHGYVMLFFNPPMGVLSLAASHVIRRKYKAGMEAADIQAIVAAATSAERELERELSKRMEEQFAGFTEQIRAEVASVYADGIARIEEFLDRGAARHRNVDARRSQITRLANETIPRLRTLLEQLDKQVVA